MERPSGKFLNDDILEWCVLPRLPVKSLMRFKCVSKRWYNLISNNQIFISKQYEYCKSLPSLNFQGLGMSQFILRDQSSLCFRDLHPYLRECKIIDSCNGLVVMAFQFKQKFSSPLWNPAWQNMPELFVGNPIYQDWKWIPDAPRSFEMGLVFDPVNSVPCYELVCPYQAHISHHSLGEPEEIGFYIFSSKTGKWRATKSNVIGPLFDSLKRNHLCVGGILYWEMGDHVMWYDTKNDCSGFLPLPFARDARSYGGGLNESNGYICYRVTGLRLEVWDMKDFQWSRSRQIQWTYKESGAFRTYKESGVIYDEAGRPFQGKLTLLTKGGEPFRCDVETGEMTGYRIFYVPSGYLLYKANLFPTPGWQQLHPLRWEQIQPELEGYICFNGVHGVLKISTRTAGEYQL